MGLLGGEKLIIGYDLGNEHSQISVSSGRDGEPETLSQVAGEEKYNIPTALCKRYGTNQWLCGREALRAAEEDQGILVENLFALALDGEAVIVDGESFDPVALLSLFFRRSLGNIKIASLMITCPLLDRRAVEVLGQVVGSIGIKAEHCAFQGHGESYYGYMLRQPEELWLHKSVLFDYRSDFIRVYRLECNRRTRPMVVSIEEREYEFRPPKEEMDDAFLGMAEEVCVGPVGSVYLIGDGFSEDWMKNSLRFLCRGRRVFQGNNLFSKGACCGMQERLLASEAGKKYVFLGKDKLKANVGMEVRRRGEESYCALLDAGVNWYEAKRTTELYIQDGNELVLVITPLTLGNVRGKEQEDGGGPRRIGMVLDGLPGNVARLRLCLFLKSEHCLAVEAEDLGFGQFRPSSGRVWRENLDI